ncbi:MAG: DoxX family protein [Actinobacteria bacterium]|nr:DoxX family protein [Actinomycetota bacterium]
MSTAATVLAVGLAFSFASLGTGKVLAVPSMRQRAAEVGYSANPYRGIGAFELAGAAGLLIGIAVVPLGAAAGAGLLLLLGGALLAHLRNHDEPPRIAPAGIAAALVVTYLALQLVAA